MQRLAQDTIDYYRTKESRWGYKLVLGGTKHFGYYPPGQKHISMHQAMQFMMDEVGKALDLQPGSYVLDVGCGEGATALRLADRFKLRVLGVDILDFNIKNANKKLVKNKLIEGVSFFEGNYMKLDIPSKTFDGIYTLETLVHAPNHTAALKEFNRLLKKNGKLVLFEYSMPKQTDLTKREKWVFKTISEGSAMHSMRFFTHGSFPKILQEAGFVNVKVDNITDRMVPMLKRFWQMGIVPYQAVKLIRKQKNFVNTTASVELYKYRNRFRYNVITANKP